MSKVVEQTDKKAIKQTDKIIQELNDVVLTHTRNPSDVVNIAINFFIFVMHCDRHSFEEFLKEDGVEGEEYEKAMKEFTEDRYDSYNAAFATILQNYAPEIEQRPDLTADAIMAMENKLLEEKE